MYLTKGFDVKKLRVAMLAPPWLKIPPDGYGGIEEVLDALLPELKKLNVEVDLFTIGATPNSDNFNKKSYYKDPQYKHIHRPMYEVLPIAINQVQYALKQIEKDGNYDIIHDHNGYVGPLALYWATSRNDMPPAVHTIHGPPFTTVDTEDRVETNSFWKMMGGAARTYFIGISDALIKGAPSSLKPNILPTVHNAVLLDKFKFKAEKQDHFITLARFSHEKAQHVAAKLCSELEIPLLMAGTVAGIETPRQLTLEIANPISPYRNVPDFKYYSDKVLPITAGNKLIRYVGNVAGEQKMDFVANAKALLFPIDWDEPFGMAVIEAMASGTPVVAMNRGAMPEIIEHGTNGFLANSEKEFKHYMQRVSEIDPHECRKSVERNFSGSKMAKEYLERYLMAIDRDKQPK